MNLLFRLLRFIALTIFNFLLSLIVLIFTLVVLPLLIRLGRLLRDLVSLSFTATVNGPAEFTARLASQWTRWVIEAGLDQDRIDEIYSLCWFFAASVIILGWVVSILFTATLIRVIYGWFFI